MPCHCYRAGTRRRAGLWLTVIALVIPALLAFAKAAAVASKPAEITWVVPFQAGGGADEWARFVAPHLAAQFAEPVAIKVVNIAGGGSTKAANLYAMYPHGGRASTLDGTRILSTSGSTQFAFLLDDPRVRYDYSQWQVLLAYAMGGVVYIAPELGIAGAGDLKRLLDKPLYYGSQGATSLDLVALLGFDLLGLDVRPIFGMRGRAAGRLAFERGDVTIDSQTTAAYLSKVQPLVDRGLAVPLFTFGALDERGNMIRDPNFPELPSILEVYERIHSEKPGGVGWDSWLGFFTAGFGAQKLLLIPKAAPAAIKDSFRVAIAAMLADPAYLAAKERVLGRYPQVGGATAQRLYRMAIDIPAAQKQWVKDWTNDKYKLNF